MRAAARALAGLVGHEDGLTATCNTIALVLAGNTPFYPLYLWAVLGRDAGPFVLLTLASLPFWLAVPLLARRSGYAARALLCTVATLNTAWCNHVLGFSSGVALFLIPCVMLATLGFHQSERRTMFALAGLPFLAYAALRLAPMPPVATYPAAAAASLATLNGFSVACLTFFLGLAFATVRPAAPPARR